MANPKVGMGFVSHCITRHSRVYGTTLPKSFFLVCVVNGENTATPTPNVVNRADFAPYPSVLVIEFVVADEMVKGLKRSTNKTGISSWSSSDQNVKPDRPKEGFRSKRNRRPSATSALIALWKDAENERQPKRRPNKKTTRSRRSEMRLIKEARPIRPTGHPRMPEYSPQGLLWGDFISIFIPCVSKNLCVFDRSLNDLDEKILTKNFMNILYFHTAENKNLVSSGKLTTQVKGCWKIEHVDAGAFSGPHFRSF